MKKITAVCLLAAVWIFAACGCSRQKETISKTEMLMDTVVTVTLWDYPEPEVLDDCMELCEKLDRQFDSDNPGGEIFAVNSKAGQTVKISDETRTLLEMGQRYEALSEGRFSMEIGPLSSLWDFHPESAYLPSEEEIKASLIKTKQASLELSAESARLSGDGAALDVGAIAKGYTADLLKEFLTAQGVKSGIIDLGGNVLLIGEKPDHSPFSVGIQKPFAKTGETLLGVKASDSSVVTSGIYQRYFEKNGQLYHHILDPDTGYPVKTDLYSVTVLSARSADGDALSTVCMLLGLEEGKKLIEKTKDTEAIFVTDQQDVIYTSGISREMIINEHGGTDHD